MTVYEQIQTSNSVPFRYHYADSSILKTYGAGWHTDIEIIMMTEGACNFICDGNKFTAHAGDIAVINSEVVHDLFLEDNSKFICFIIDEKFCAGNGIPITELRFDRLIHDDKLCGLFQNILDQYTIYAMSRCLDTRIKIALLQFLAELCERYTETVLTVSKKRSRNEHVKKAIDFIKNNLNEKITVKSIADHVKLSPTHLSAEFKRKTGKTIIEFTNIERCNLAYGLLQKGFSVTDAAISCGFENMSYFSETFKKYMGGVPSDFRQ